MAVFSYTGIDRNEVTVRGTVAADTPRQARDQLRGQGVRVRKLAEAAITPVAPLDVAAFAASSPGAVGDRGARVVDDAVCGHPACSRHSTRSLSRAEVRFAPRCWVCATASPPAPRWPKPFEQRPDLFDAASIQMVEVGENSGTLDVGPGATG